MGGPQPPPPPSSPKHHPGGQHRARGSPAGTHRSGPCPHSQQGRGSGAEVELLSKMESGAGCWAAAGTEPGGREPAPHPESPQFAVDKKNMIIIKKNQEGAQRSPSNPAISMLALIL